MPGFVNDDCHTNSITTGTFLLKDDLLMHFKGGKRERCFLLVHSPNGSRTWAWSKPKQGAKNSILVSHEDGRDTNSWATFCWLPRSIGRTLDQKPKDFSCIVICS